MRQVPKDCTWSTHKLPYKLWFLYEYTANLRQLFAINHIDLSNAFAAVPENSRHTTCSQNNFKWSLGSGFNRLAVCTHCVCKRIDQELDVHNKDSASTETIYK